ncbi:MAG: redoxin domain-containing protein [Pseudomonadota bacterium]
MRLKSLLLTPLLLALSGLTLFALFKAATGVAPIAWVGVALAAAPLPAFVSYLMATESAARTSANMPGAFMISGLGVALSLAGSSSPLQPLLAGAAFAGLAWYIFVYSRYGRRPSKALALGAALPDFDLKDANGYVVPSSDFTQQPALFLFYRGNWCPLCMAQIKKVAAAYQRLAAKGVAVALVSPQPAKETATLAAKFDVPFRFLIDEDGQAARALDIFAKGGTPLGVDAMGYGADTVLPTVIATDASGRIIFLDQTDNYRVRPEPETFLAIFEASGARPSGGENAAPSAINPAGAAA